MTMKLRLLSLSPDQMNSYADRGNILFLQHRCEWRGIDFEVTRCGPGEEFDPGEHDLLYMGGGQDRDQKAVARDLIETKQFENIEKIIDNLFTSKNFRQNGYL